MDLLESLKERCLSVEYKLSLKLLCAYTRNIVDNPTVDKYRKLRIGNEKFNKHIWIHEECRTLLLLHGFELKEEFVILPLGLSITVLNDLLQRELCKIEPNKGNDVSKSTVNEGATSANLSLIGARSRSIFDEQKADFTLVSYLLQMGYSKHAAEKGLIATGNVGVQPAMDWIADHPECINKNEEMEIPQSGQTFTQGVREDSKETSKLSSRLGKFNEDKHRYQEKMRLQAIEKARLEKMEEKRSREQLKRNLQTDRLESKERFEREKLIRHSEENQNSSKSQQQDSTSRCCIRIKLPNEQSSIWEGDKNASVKSLCSHVMSLIDQSDQGVQIFVPPNEQLDIADETSIHEKGLFPKATVLVRYCNQPSHEDMNTDDSFNEQDCQQSNEQSTT